MAGRKRSAPGSAGRSATSRQTRASITRDAVPDIYRQMLTDAEVRPIVESPERPLKRRRRPGEKPAASQPSNPTAPAPTSSKLQESEDEEDDAEFEDVSIPVPTVQTMLRDSDEEDDDDDDDNDDEELQFENIDLSFPDLNLNADETNKDAPKELMLDLSARTNTTQRKVVDRRKPINRMEKDRRVEIHKTHLLCLMSHAARRNRWCNDGVVQKTLRKLLNKEMIKYLNPGAELSQFGQTNSLKTGLQKVEFMFKTNYQVTERGLHRSLWADNEEHLQKYRIPDDAESPMEKSDFRAAAKALKGSRDVGAQLYCALLRSAGVEARLVCSLQPLSFASGGPSMSKPPKSRKKLTIEEQYARRPKYDNSFDSPALHSSTPIRRRFGHPNATAFNVPTVSPVPPSQVQDTPKKIRECQFPVYWVEVLDVAHQKWQPVDPLVTQSFWKSQVFEPPASERENSMTYVVGFEADGVAKDVTRRYAKAYNAKTRKMRVESVVANGERWWKKALKAYSRGYMTDIDQIESNELAAVEAREPMPRNVADFKDHPIYALERHLRRHEVLVPGASSAGTVGAGSKGPLERIYRRKDVRVARTREKWYRMGREVAGDQIPVKFLPKPVKKRGNAFDDEVDDENNADDVGTPIFTMEQTTLYRAPPVIDGVIPKNRYGNLDIYVPSMIPEGGAYIADEYGAQAAFTLRIDYAPALTGFQFKGRHGTAVLYGVVVAAEHEEAVRAVIEGLLDQEADKERERRTREVLRMWKRLLMNLRVRQRIWAGVDSDEEAGEAVVMDVDVDEGVDSVDEIEGNEGQQSDDGEEFAGGFIVDEDDYGGGF